MANTKELERLINEAGIKKKKVYGALHMSFGSYKRRMDNQVPFTIDEAEIISELLHLTPKQKIDIFFAK